MKIANINKQYLIIGLKNIYHNRNKRYNCILSKIKTDNEFIETIIKKFYGYLVDVTKNTFRLWVWTHTPKTLVTLR